MFATWKAEEPGGRVLKTDPKIVKEEDYESADWEDKVGKFPVKVAKAPGGPLEPRTLVVGIAIKGKSKAWPHASVLSSGATIDQVGDVPVALVVSPDERSLRAFDRRVKDQTLTFVRAGTDLKESTLLDLETMTEWDFQGRAVKGELAGSQLSTGGLPAGLLVRLEDVPPGHGSAEALDAGEEEGEERDPDAEGAW